MVSKSIKYVSISLKAGLFANYISFALLTEKNILVPEVFLTPGEKG